MEIMSYRDLIAWQKAMDLVTAIYRATAGFPRDEIYGLTSQLRRAAVSTPSNIAEGQGRQSTREFIHFLSIAYGSLNEAQTQILIAERLKVAVQSVHAYIAGEHGDSEIPLWSSASVANIPLHDWAVQGHGKMTVRDRTEIFQNVKNAAAQIIEGKGATNYAIGLATAKILEAILHDENRVLPVSSLLTDFRGISDVCMSVPCIVNRHGVDAALPVPLNAAEEAGLKNSAETIQATLKSLGF